MAQRELQRRRGACGNADECRALDIPFIFDPGQQCARLSGDELLHGLRGARMLISNDYEHELIRDKTGLNERELLHAVDAIIITRGERGATIVGRDRRADVPAVPADRVADPTGVGDAYRGGLMKGLALGLDLLTCAQIGSVAATYALEHVGGQSHSYTLPEFIARYERHFGPVNL